jgi:hypothetical protein
VTARDEQPAPVTQRRFDPHDRDRSLRPDELERSGREIQLPHVSNASFETIRHPEPLRLLVQNVDEGRVVVDREEPRGRVRGQHSRLQASAAAEIGDASLGPDAGHEREGSQRTRRVSRSLSREATEHFEEQAGHPVLSHCVHSFQTPGHGAPARSLIARCAAHAGQPVSL